MAVQHAPLAPHEARMVVAQDAHPCHGADAPSEAPAAQASSEHSGACGDCSVCHGPLAGLAARAVVVLDGNNQVLHSELVAEISSEPNYDSALAALA